MDIVYHFRVRGQGAEAVHIAGIADGFEAKGHRVHFVSPTGTDPRVTVRERSQPEEAKPPSTAARMLHGLADKLPQLGFEAMEVAYNGFAGPRLYQLVQRTGAGLIFERYAFFNAAGAAVAARARIPLVVEVNELAGFERVRDQRLVPLARRIERFVLRRASLIITVSDFLRERVDEVVEGQVPTLTVPNGVGRHWLEHVPDPARVRELRQRHGLDDRPVVVFVGALVPWHDFPRLIEALAIARRQVPGATLMVLGDGVEREGIAALARAQGIADGVRLIGRVPHVEVPDYLAAANVAVIPETNDYRSPIKLFEYMAMGLPVVAPAMPPIAVAIDDGVHGILCDRDAASLGRGMSRLLGDAELARRMGEAARQRALREFTYEAHAADILAHVPGLAAS